MGITDTDPRLHAILDGIPAFLSDRVDWTAMAAVISLINGQATSPTPAGEIEIAIENRNPDAPAGDIWTFRRHDRTLDVREYAEALPTGRVISFTFHPLPLP